MIPRKQSRQEAGFTLLELIVVVAVIGILATIAMPRIKDFPRRAAEAALRTDLRVMRDAIDQYYGDKGYYPSSLDALVDDGYMRKLPVDPITQTADSWEVELEEFGEGEEPAETDLPEDGAPGIADVFSGSTLLSLDGSPYNEW